VEQRKEEEILMVCHVVLGYSKWCHRNEFKSILVLDFCFFHSAAD